ncbi:outer membrane lipoprotein LolB [Rhodoferax sp.]|uniref:outer membrane lipoprotein LolB n=1 Tax=Rhodoferax sp. TaxID=50421 RepID=UPI0025F344D1|nr:outer membrane lipoprotein LolB [Rhodoferax sp.]
MSRLSRVCAHLALSFAIVFIAGCAINTRATGTFPADSQWSGRLALKVQSTPPQAFSADFELGGSPTAGLLAFYSPLGTTAARLQWAPGAATLVADGATRQFDSLEALVLQATGAELPVSALFDWLQGSATAAPGWTVDLSGLKQGRLSAVREAAELPRVELGIVLHR